MTQYACSSPDISVSVLRPIKANLRWCALIKLNPVISNGEDSAEQTKIGARVQLLHAVCALVSSLQSAPGRPERVWIPIPLDELREDDWIRTIERALVDTNVDPRLLGISVPDHNWAEQEGAVMSNIRRAHALGFNISIDHFGAGTWNPQLLKSLPLHSVQIPISCLQDAAGPTNAPSLGRALLNLARAMQLEVTLTVDASATAPSNWLSKNVSWVQDIQPGMTPDQFLLHVNQSISVHPIEPSHQRTLLLVDDEESILSALRRLFRPCGYRILIANSGDAALDLLQKESVDVIISDQRMPVMTGVEFLRKAKVIQPTSIRIVLSGYTELQSITDAINEGAIYKFLTKPWDDDLLKAQIEEAFTQKEMAEENVRLTQAIEQANIELTSSQLALERLLAKQEMQIERATANISAMHEVLNALPLPVIAIAQEGIIAFVNDAAEAISGISAALLLGEEASAALPPELRLVLHHPMPLTVQLNGRKLIASSKPLTQAGVTAGCILVLSPENGLV